VIRKILRLLATATLLTGALVIVNPAPASAAPPQTFCNRASNFCMDDSDDYGIRTFPRNGLNYQQWDVYVYGDGTRRIRNINTQRCLGANGGTSGPGSLALYEPCTANTSQSWNIERLSNGIRFVNERFGSCIEDRGGNHFGGRLMGLTSCIGGYYPPETVWY
jgi:hypothetical protein